MRHLGDLWASIGAKRVLVGLATVIVLLAGTVANGYVQRLEELEDWRKKHAEAVQQIKSDVEVIKREIEWIARSMGKKQ